MDEEKKVKVFIISGKCPEKDDDPLIGGAEKAPYRIAKYLALEKDLDVKFLYFKGPQLESDTKYLIKALPGKLYLTTIFREISILLYYKKIFKADILQIHHPHYALMAGFIRFITNKKIKIIIKAHGTASPEFRTLRAKGLRGILLAISNWLHFKHDKLALYFADICICSSEFQKKEMNELYGVNKNKLITIYNGYDPEYFPQIGLVRKDKSLLIVARAVPKKNIKYAFKIFLRLYEMDSNYTLTVVAGSRSRIEDPDTHKYIVENLLNRNGVQILYDLTELQIAQLYARSEFFLCPSVEYESIPSVLYEAMVSGCKILATNDWGIPEILNSESFLTLDSSLDTEKIIKLSKEEAEYDFGKYSYSRLIKSYRELYV